MARYTATKAAGLLFEEGIVDSGDESEIEEDPCFPLPCTDDDEEALLREPLPLSPLLHTVDDAVELAPPLTHGPTTSDSGTYYSKNNNTRTTH